MLSKITCLIAPDRFIHLICAINGPLNPHSIENRLTAAPVDVANTILMQNRTLSSTIEFKSVSWSGITLKYLLHVVRESVESACVVGNGTLRVRRDNVRFCMRIVLATSTGAAVNRFSME